MVCCVYGLSSSEDGVIRYVGQTTQRPEKRLASHLYPSKRTAHTYVARWVGGVLSRGHRVQMLTLEDDAVYSASERQWIARLRAEGFSLVNLTDGGEGAPGHVVSAKVRAAVSAAQKGRPKSAEHRAKISKSLMGRPAPVHVGALVSAAHKGKRPKNLDAIHASLRGKPKSEEHRAKLAAATRLQWQRKRGEI